MRYGVTVVDRPRHDLISVPRAAVRYGRSSWLMALVAGALLVFAALHRPPPAPTPTGPLVVASMPYWNLAHGTDTVLAAQPSVSEASPWIYGLDTTGRIVPQYPPGQATEIAAQVGRLRAAGLRIVPTLANITNGGWAYQPVARMLHDPVRLDQHVAAIVGMVRREGYAGVDIDYEDLHSSDRMAFSEFITKLSAALHADGRVLSVAVFAKTTDAGYDQRNVAQDYAAIGRAADQVRVMAYDYHWTTSPPGPIAPIDWVRAVLEYAKSQIPASKIVLGIPLYGYDWTGSGGAGVTWQRACQLAALHHSEIQFDDTSQSAWFDYTDASGSRHEVWFETAESSRAKFDAARDARIGGVFLWMFGAEDPGTWAQLHHIELTVTANPSPTEGGN